MCDRQKSFGQEEVKTNDFKFKKLQTNPFLNI